MTNFSDPFYEKNIIALKLLHFIKVHYFESMLGNLPLISKDTSYIHMLQISRYLNVHMSK